MAGFLEELAAGGRARRIELPGCREGERWILAEEAATYESAFGTEAEPAQSRAAAESILCRFLDTHALVSLKDILDRYPLEASWARQKLDEYAQNGRVVPIRPGADLEPLQWSAPGNLEQVERSALSLLRREVVSCPPTQYADFVCRWQFVHPSSRQGAAEGLAAVLSRLEGLALTAELWEKTILPSRVPGYQPRWLDEAIASGDWTWVGRAESGFDQVAFWQRGNLSLLPAPTIALEAPLDTSAERVLDCLRERGASFVADLARDSRLPPTILRTSLWQLLHRGLVTNDDFAVVRRGEPRDAESMNDRHPTARMRPLHSRARAGRRRTVAEGRWSLIPWGLPEAEARAFFLARVLLERYGIVARELAAMDPSMMPWRVLYEVLSRMELAGDVRRGYFVEGLSGAQFALPEAARQLQEVALPSTVSAPLVLLQSLDPANLYGSGAPFDIPLLDGGTRPLVRRAGNWLVMRAGRPVMIIEQGGRRLTALASASQDEIAQAVAMLPSTLDGDRRRGGRHKITVEEWNGQRVTDETVSRLLEAAGFVRDYQGMTLYAAWK
jgi:ATP-dependent Lhr-like helicase